MSSSSLSLQGVDQQSAPSFSTMLGDTDAHNDFLLSSDDFSSLSGSHDVAPSFENMAFSPVHRPFGHGHINDTGMGYPAPSSGAYIRLLNHNRAHQNQLRQMSQEFERLKSTHEDLVKTHKVLMDVLAEKRKEDRSPHCEPVVDSSPSESFPTHGPASNSTRLSQNMKHMKPLLRSKYPQIRFWTKLDWKRHESNRKDTSDLEPKATSSARGGARSSKGENVMMLYVENADGTIINGALASEIRDFARSIWRGFYLRGVAPEKWGNASKDIREEYYSQMEAKFDILQYCDNHWKAHAVATTIYSQWHHVSHKKKHVPAKDESDLDDEPLKKRVRTSETAMDIHDTRPPQPEHQGVTAIAPAPSTTRESVVGVSCSVQVEPWTEASGMSAPTPNGLRNPLTPFVVLDVVPEDVSRSPFPCISELRDDDQSQGYDDNSNPVSDTEPDLSHAMSTTTPTPVTHNEEIFDSLRDGINTKTTEHVTTRVLRTSASAEHVVPMQPAPSERTGGNLPPTSPPLEEAPIWDNTTVPPLASSTTSHQHKAGNTSRYSRTRKMQPGSAVTARNICATEWCASHPNGSAGEFNQYWDILDTQTKSAYKRREKEAKATAVASVKAGPK
ncbi:hypothetical protein BC826DRAFT_1106374 [Russula brevipes]|nr:hypothetical protein BC826DRAFT_1106374 [Russula brevipes]